MQSGTQARPTVGLPAAHRSAGRDDSPTGRTRGGPATWPTPVLSVIDGRAAHADHGDRGRASGIPTRKNQS